MIKLESTEEDKVKLLETIQEYNKACNFVADRAFTLKLSNKFKLQKEVYREIRERFNLTAQFAIRIISKVVEAYKKDKTIKPTFKILGSIQYDQRNSRVCIDEVSLMTLKGRLKLKARVGDYQRVRFDRVKGQCDLIYRNNTFYLIVVVDAPEKSEYDATGILGIDLGIENIATDSDRQIFESKKVEEKRQKYLRLRSTLQRTGTKSAKRKLKRLSGKERRFKKDTNHVISKSIISKAKGTIRAIAIEDLKGIRSKVTVISRGSQRDKYSKWAFGELRNFLTYKSKIEGVPLIVVNPKKTSTQCPECQYTDKQNRKARNEFQCIGCGYNEMSDYVAARNIVIRAAVNQPVVTPVLVVTSHDALAHGS